MPSDTNISNLIINKLTNAQYTTLKNSQQVSDTELYMITDDQGTPEDVSNKVTSLSSSSTDTQYPSAKCVYDYIQSLDATEEEY